MSDCWIGKIDLLQLYVDFTGLSGQTMAGLNNPQVKIQSDLGFHMFLDNQIERTTEVTKRSNQCNVNALKRSAQVLWLSY